MNIDILAYELKYKNDEMVMALLTAFQEEQARANENQHDLENHECDTSDFDDLAERVSDFRDTMESTIEDIQRAMRKL
jgi:uncharacterized phage-like protein YoqJ